MSADGSAPDQAASRNDATGRRRTVTLVAAAMIGLAGVVAGYSLALSHARDAQADAYAARQGLSQLAQAHEKLQERTWMLFLQTQETSPGAPPATPPADGVFTEGIYLVGKDIEAGTYRGEVTGELGYWARLNATDGMVSAIEANDVVRGPFVLTILPRDAAVELRGVTLSAAE